MIRQFASIALILGVLAFSAAAYTTILLPNTQECYYERMKSGTHFSITFETASKLPIEFVLNDVNRNPIYTMPHTGEGSYSYVSTSEGRYSYCFKNNAPHEIVVNFNPHGPDEEKFLTNHDATPAENEVRKLSHNIEEVRDHFNFMLFRNEVHEHSVSATQGRMFSWAILQTLVLAGACGWQIYYVRSLFKVRGVV
ncbi:p24 complex component [Coemansia spiralis]|uniref:P24 complex component n=2 Tax=Coemansia TaxID=4863 RepID=A0A9W8G9B1_9FUNG|nr:emp24/gp25L/p24 family/GOLD-domain-containing protein [Coemansia spiralis]KAJ1995185.1 p24 complex component [Coemansia umbellata]KAJ2625586.1 p24 complex component [Coemansia sp. RSA 1358]KAJ2678720.1 p24 complex component [Coemansia spiralis]